MMSILVAKSGGVQEHPGTRQLVRLIVQSVDNARVGIGLEETQYPGGFLDFLAFLCSKYGVDRNRLFVEYSSRPPPPLKGSRAGYYEGLLSFREKNGHLEFLITVFRASREPLVTLAHEFAHLVKNLKLGSFDKYLRPPDDAAERSFDDQAVKDLAEFRSSR